MNQQPERSEIVNVTFEKAGVMDGVEMMAKCTVSTFKVEDGKVTGIAGIATAPCKIMASYENGIASVSVRGEAPFMLSVRLDEMMELLRAASARAIEVRKKGTDEK